MIDETKQADVEILEGAAEEKEVRGYEVMISLNPDLLESKLKSKLKDFEDFVVKSNGKITSFDNWGRRPMAYKIGKFTEGIYVVYDVLIPTDFVREINEHLRIDADVLRFIIITIPKGYAYTKFAEEPVQEEPEDEKPKRKRAEKPINFKTSAPALAPESPKKPEMPEKEIDTEALEKKLDEILGDTDLKL